MFKIKNYREFYIYTLLIWLSCGVTQYKDILHIIKLCLLTLISNK